MSRQTEQKRIYLDHAATSWPKPAAVAEGVLEALGQSGNPGRSGHLLSLNGARLIHQARNRVGRLFNAKNPAQIVFALNATDALNMAIKGLVEPGTHVITTCWEHNSVLRPLYALEKQGVIELTVLTSPEQGPISAEDFRAAMQPNTALVVVTHASNVIGVVHDLTAIGQLCREQGARLMVDASQTAGLLPLDVEALGIDALACSGHKGLLGPQGTGVLYLSPQLKLRPWREGGTGSISHELYQPEFMPDKLEAGTPNTPGIAGLGAAVAELERIGLSALREHERALTKRLRQGLQSIAGITIYGAEHEDNVGVISCNLDNWDGAELAVVLEQEFGILTRPGLHCAPLAHQAIGTYPHGTVRISVGYNTTTEEVDAALTALEDLTRP